MKNLIDKYGWKTLLGTVLLTSGQAIKAYAADYQSVGDLVMMIGTALGGIGIIGKFNKIGDKK